MTDTCQHCSSDLENPQKEIDTVDLYGTSYTYKQCRQCKLYGIYPEPTASELTRAYSDQYYGENDTKFNPFIERFINAMRYRKGDKLRKLLTDGDHILDIGCGNGNFLKYLNRHGDFVIHGVELPGKSAERAKQVPELNLFLGPFEDYQSTEVRFQLITLIHVIEHLKNPIDVLKKCESMLTPEGALYIAYPNIESRQAQEYKGNWLHLDPPRHLNFIPPDVLKSLMANAGFNCIYENHYSLEYNPYGEIQSWLNVNSPQRDFLFEKLKGNKLLPENAQKMSFVKALLKGLVYSPVAFVKSGVHALQKSGACVELIFKRSDDN